MRAENNTPRLGCLPAGDPRRQEVLTLSLDRERETTNRAIYFGRQRGRLQVFLHVQEVGRWGRGHFLLKSPSPLSNNRNNAESAEIHLKPL